MDVDGALTASPTDPALMLTIAESSLLLADLRARFWRADTSLRVAIIKRPDANRSEDQQILQLTRNRDELFEQLVTLSKKANLPLYFDLPPLPPPSISDQQTEKATQKRASKDYEISSSEESDSGFTEVKRKAKKPKSTQGASKPQKAKTAVNLKNKKQTEGTLASTSDHPTDAELAQSQNSKNSDAQKKGAKIPPFFIVPPAHWSAMLAVLRRSAPTIKSKFTGKFLRLTVGTQDEHRALTRYLLEEKVQFKSFLLNEDRPTKIVIRGLPKNTSVDLIKAELEMHGLVDPSVVQMYRGPVSKRIHMPLFLILLPKNAENNIDSVFQISELMGTEVTMERFRGKKGPTQCHNCQTFFHSAAVCHLSSRCVRCGQNHKSTDCEKPYEQPCKCANCGGEHPANYRLCPRFPKSAASAKPTSNVRTFTSRKVDQSQSFAAAVAPPVATPPSKIQNSPSETDSNIDVLNYIIALEKSYSPVLIAAAFKKALPALRAVSSSVDRQCIIYTAVVAASSGGSQ